MLCAAMDGANGCTKSARRDSGKPKKDPYKAAIVLFIRQDNKKTRFLRGESGFSDCYSALTGIECPMTIHPGHEMSLGGPSSELLFTSMVPERLAIN
jgi:hypothetical protein